MLMSFSEHGKRISCRPFLSRYCILWQWGLALVRSLARYHMVGGISRTLPSWHLGSLRYQQCMAVSSNAPMVLSLGCFALSEDLRCDHIDPRKPVEDVVAGEVLWGATKSLFNATIVLIVIEIAGATFIPSIFFTVSTVLLLPLISFICGLMFTSIAMIFTAWVPNIDAFNYPFYLLVTPMFLFGGTFFPISALGSLEIIAYVLPLTHASILIHDMSYGIFTWLDVVAVVYIIVITFATFIPAMNMMKKRLIR